MMTLLRSPGLVRAAVRRGAIVLLAALVLVAHGCHGDDVDHELGVAVPGDASRDVTSPVP